MEKDYLKVSEELHSDDFKGGVAAIDFGSVYTKWTGSLKQDLRELPDNTVKESLTLVLIRPDGKTLEAFGTEAQTKYKQLLRSGENGQYFYFTNFLTQLTEQLRAEQKVFEEACKLEDVAERKLSALTVVSAVFEYISKDIKNTFKKKLLNWTDILWVFTVPTVWSQTGKLFMRQAAEAAKLPSDSFVIIDASVAVSTFFRNASTQPSWKTRNPDMFMIVDAGGTLDLSVHADKDSTNATTSKRYNKAGTLVNDAFLAFFEKLFGEDVFNKYKTGNLEEFIKLKNVLEERQKYFTTESKPVFKFTFPMELLQVVLLKQKTKTEGKENEGDDIYVAGDKLVIKERTILELVDAAVRETVSNINTFLRDENIKPTISAILMVGGFSDCPLFQKAMKITFPKLELLFPNQPSACILKGAVTYGNHQDHNALLVLPYTYGIECTRPFRDTDPESKKTETKTGTVCRKVFDTHAKVGQRVRMGKAGPDRTYSPIYSNQEDFTLTIVAVDKSYPEYTDEMGCFIIGELTIDLPSHQEDKKPLDKVRTCMYFTEEFIVVKAKLEATGQVTQTYFRTMDTKKKHFVTSIDFGTSFSGWAFSTRDDYEWDPTKCQTQLWESGSDFVSEKTLTKILIKQDCRTVQAFGFEAEEEYIVMDVEEQEKCYFFTEFKMRLHQNLNEKTLDRNIMLYDAAGRPLPAMTVVSLVIEYLSRHVLVTINKQFLRPPTRGEFVCPKFTITRADIKWVFTVPAIWTDAAKQFMREAADLAGISPQLLDIVLEPNAASVYCRHLPVQRSAGQTQIYTLTAGDKYMVVDAGGGTVDITVHKVIDKGRVTEVISASGGPWGGTLVNKHFRAFLAEIIGHEHSKKLTKASEEFGEIEKELEHKKKSFNPDEKQPVRFRLPHYLVIIMSEAKSKKEQRKNAEINKALKEHCLQIKGDKLIIPCDKFLSFFSKATDLTVNHIKTLMNNERVKDISAILMVGGFSDSKVLQEAVKKAFTPIPVIVPQQANLCVLKGAVMLGHNPNFFSQKH